LLEDPLRTEGWLIGKLMYLTISCLITTFSASKMSQYMSKECISHPQAINQILQYLKT